jgi:two-component system cell cycle response regulator CpdR
MSEQPKRVGPDAAGARLLVVEDFEALRVLIIRVLSADGHQVAAVATAQAAYERLAIEDFDLIVTDVQVPGGNGTEVARRGAIGHAGLRVLFVSGTAEHEVDLDVPGARTEYLQKPFDIDVLVEMVRCMLADDPDVPKVPVLIG